MLVVKATFGPKLDERQRRAQAGGFHGSCWVNDDDCGDPDCLMACHPGVAEQVQLPEAAIQEKRQA